MCVCVPISGVILSFIFYYVMCNTLFCEGKWPPLVLTLLIINITLVSISLAILFFGIGYSKLANNEANAKRERRMILHTVVSSILMIVNSAMTYVTYSTLITDKDVRIFLYSLISINGTVESYVPIIFLFLINESFRFALFKLLKVEKCLTRRTGGVVTVP
uniref:Serpentine receptor class gamma n=1 Tax=Panagrellus redivivus TaxID=6233 RepID=A0A7E4WAS4_PANRE